jgi:hypothetical protein
MSKNLSRMNMLIASGSAAVVFGVLGSGCSAEAPATPIAPTSEAPTSSSAPVAENCSILGEVIPGHEDSLKISAMGYTALTEGGDVVKADELEQDSEYLAQSFAVPLADGTLPAGTVFEIRGLAKKSDEADKLSAAASGLSVPGMTLEPTAGKTFTPEAEWPYAYQLVPHAPRPADAPCVPKFQLTANL